MIKALLWAALVLAASAAAHAQRRYTQEEIVAKIAECMVENAPDDWQRLIFKLDQEPPGGGRKGKATIEHKVVPGTADGAPRDLKPCRPDYVPKAVNTFRETQDEKARRWTGITVTMERDGRYTVNFRYPK